MTWITTPLIAGALAQNSYNNTITGLIPSTKYRYRAYFIVDGVEYYGNILTGTTSNIALSKPTVTTGNVNAVNIRSITVDNNNVTSDGGAPIIEYGTLYTVLGVYGTSNNLVVENTPTNVNKQSYIQTGSLPINYSNIADGLLPNTLTYFRAFARNAVGVSYGVVKSQLTAELPPPPPPPTTYTIKVSYPKYTGSVYFTPSLDGYESGATVTVTGLSVGGRFFHNWKLNGVTIDVNPIEIEIMGGNVELLAYFEDYAI